MEKGKAQEEKIRNGEREGVRDSRDSVLEGFSRTREYQTAQLRKPYHVNGLSPIFTSSKATNAHGATGRWEMHKNKELTLQDQRHYSALSVFITTYCPVLEAR